MLRSGCVRSKGEVQVAKFEELDVIIISHARLSLSLSATGRSKVIVATLIVNMQRCRLASSGNSARMDATLMYDGKGSVSPSLPTTPSASLPETASPAVPDASPATVAVSASSSELTELLAVMAKCTEATSSTTRWLQDFLVRVLLVGCSVILITLSASTFFVTWRAPQVVNVSCQAASPQAAPPSGAPRPAESSAPPQQLDEDLLSEAKKYNVLREGGYAARRPEELPYSQ
jgi:hypothetical protein